MKVIAYNGSVESLEKLASKKSSYNEVFMHIHQGFMNALNCFIDWIVSIILNWTLTLTN